MERLGPMGEKVRPWGRHPLGGTREEIGVALGPHFPICEPRRTTREKKTAETKKNVLDEVEEDFVGIEGRQGVGSQSTTIVPCEARGKQCHPPCGPDTNEKTPTRLPPIAQHQDTTKQGTNA